MIQARILGYYADYEFLVTLIDDITLIQKTMKSIKDSHIELLNYRKTGTV